MLRCRAVPRDCLEGYLPASRTGSRNCSMRTPSAPQAAAPSTHPPRPVIPEGPAERGSPICENRHPAAPFRPSLFNESAPAVSIAVTLFPSPEAGLETAIRRGCFKGILADLLVRRGARYCSLGRHWPSSSNGNSGEVGRTWEFTVQIAAADGVSMAVGTRAVASTFGERAAQLLGFSRRTCGRCGGASTEGQVAAGLPITATVQYLECSAHAGSALCRSLNLPASFASSVNDRVRDDFSSPGWPPALNLRQPCQNRRAGRQLPTAPRAATLWRN